MQSCICRGRIARSARVPVIAHSACMQGNVAELTNAGTKQTCQQAQSARVLITSCAGQQERTRARAARSSLRPPSAHVGEHHRGACDQDCQAPAAYAQIDNDRAVPPASVQGGEVRVWRQHRRGLRPRWNWHVCGRAEAAGRLHILPRWYVWRRQGQRCAPGRWVWVLRWAAALRHAAAEQQHSSQEQRNGRRSSTPATRRRA